MAVIRRIGRSYQLDARVAGRRCRQTFKSRDEAEDALLRLQRSPLKRSNGAARVEVSAARSSRLNGPTLGDLFDGWRAHALSHTDKPRYPREIVRRLGKHFKTI